MQFKRYVEILFPDFSITSDKLTIEFDIPFDNDTEPNESTVTIYNLSQTTRNNIKQNDKIIINAGYVGDIGTVIEGRVSYIENDHTGADKATTIYILDSNDLEGFRTINKSYAANIKASSIVKDLLPQLGLPIGKMDFPNDPTYAEGYTAEGDLKEAISKLAGDVGVSFYINRGKAYFHYIHGSSINSDIFTLSADTGLIGIPEPFDDKRGNGYKVKCLLQHRIYTASTINLQSKFVKGIFRVTNGSHRCSSSEFITYLEVVS